MTYLKVIVLDIEHDNTTLDNSKNDNNMEINKKNNNPFENLREN